MRSLADYLYQSLKLPVIALFLAAGTVMMADPFIEFSLIETGLIVAGIFTVLVTIKNHFVQIKLGAEIRRHLNGISEFEHDINKRLENVSTHQDDRETLTSVSQRLDGLEKKLNISLKN